MEVKVGIDVNDLIEISKEIIEKEYLEKLNDNLYHGKKYLEIDFDVISKHNLDLADHLLNDPEETLKAMQIAVQLVNDDFYEDDLRITSELIGKTQITNLPDSCRIPIWELRKQIKQFIKLEGYISELGDVLLRPVLNKYECPICGNIINVLRKDEFTAIKEPKKCSCGKTGKFILLRTDTINIRKIMLEEDLMELGERQIPKKKVILLKGYLTSKEIDKIMCIGKKVIINGWLDTFEINEKTGDMDTYFIANHIEFIERGWPMIKVTKQEKKKFDEMVKEPKFIDNLKQSIMPGIHGEDKIKEALLLQLISSDNVYDKDNFLEDRGNIHVALVGPPGSGKSYSIKYIGKFWPIYRFSSAQTATGRGLIATAIQEKQLDNKWVLTPGVIPTCSGGLCSIDELDKMNKEDYGYLNNAMNDLKVFIEKAARGILDTDTAILASLNPIGRVFVKGEDIYKQIGLPPDLLDRFDIILPMYAKAEEEDQRKVFRIGLSKRRTQEEIRPVYDKETIIKFVAYTRTIKPEVSDEMAKTIEDRVIKFMRPGMPQEQQQISNRIFGVIFRFIFAYARLHLRKDVTIDDLNNTMDLLVYSYQEQGLLTKDGLFDFARTERVDITAVNIHKAVMNKINEISKNLQIIPIEDIFTSLEHDYDLDKIEETIEKLKTQGEIFEPRRGFIQKL